MSKQLHQNNTLQKPADRLLYIRKSLLRVSREYIKEKYGLSIDTLRAWETGKAPLTAKGLERCVNIYRTEGVVLSDKWILTGEGLDPKLGINLARYFSEVQEAGPDIHALNEDIRIAQEAEHFKKLNPHAVTMQVSSKEMLPFYAPGDAIGGRLKYAEAIDECIGKDCIVKTVSGEQYFRRIAKSATTGGYNLVCLNPLWGGTPEPVLFDIEIEAAAPIIWHRRYEDF